MCQGLKMMLSRHLLTNSQKCASKSCFWPSRKTVYPMIIWHVVTEDMDYHSQLPVLVLIGVLMLSIQWRNTSQCINRIGIERSTFSNIPSTNTSALTYCYEPKHADSCVQTFTFELTSTGTNDKIPDVKLSTTSGWCNNRWMCVCSNS